MTGHEDHVERPDPGGAEVAGLRALADEQAAVLRVAEQIARTAEPGEVLATVTAEASRLLGGHATTLVRFDGDRELVVVASHDGPAPIGSRITFEPATLPDRVLRGGAVVRVDDYTAERDAELARSFGLAAAVAAPVRVAGAVWGMLAVTSAARAAAAGHRTPTGRVRAARHRGGRRQPGPDRAPGAGRRAGGPAPGGRARCPRRRLGGGLRRPLARGVGPARRSPRGPDGLRRQRGPRRCHVQLPGARRAPRAVQRRHGDRRAVPHRAVPRTWPLTRATDAGGRHPGVGHRLDHGRPDRGRGSRPGRARREHRRPAAPGRHRGPPRAVRRPGRRRDRQRRDAREAHRLAGARRRHRRRDPSATAARRPRRRAAAAGSRGHRAQDGPQRGRGRVRRRPSSWRRR